MLASAAPNEDALCLRSTLAGKAVVFCLTFFRFISPRFCVIFNDCCGFFSLSSNVLSVVVAVVRRRSAVVSAEAQLTLVRWRTERVSENPLAIVVTACWKVAAPRLVSLCGVFCVCLCTRSVSVIIAFLSTALRRRTHVPPFPVRPTHSTPGLPVCLRSVSVGLRLQQVLRRPSGISCCVRNLGEQGKEEE